MGRILKIFHPDILLVRMTSDSVRPPEKRYGYPNALSGLVSLIKEEGVKGLARGIGTNSTRAMLMNVSTHDQSLHLLCDPYLGVRPHRWVLTITSKHHFCGIRYLSSNIN